MHAMDEPTLILHHTVSLLSSLNCNTAHMASVMCKYTYIHTHHTQTHECTHTHAHHTHAHTHTHTHTHTHMHELQ